MSITSLALAQMNVSKTRYLPEAEFRRGSILGHETVGPDMLGASGLGDDPSAFIAVHNSESFCLLHGSAVKSQIDLHCFLASASWVQTRFVFVTSALYPVVYRAVNRGPYLSDVNLPKSRETSSSAEAGRPLRLIQ